MRLSVGQWWETTNGAASARGTIIDIEIKGTSAENVALWQAHGTWHLQGYFADHGFVDVWMGRETYRITMLSDVEAVS
jgi:hypothetical protein